MAILDLEVGDTFEYEGRQYQIYEKGFLSQLSKIRYIKAMSTDSDGVHFYLQDKTF